MELNYQYFDGRYEKVRHSKVQKMNEILNLKNFQEEVDRRIRKFEHVVHSSQFAPSILHRMLIYAIAVFALVSCILFAVSYLRVDSSTYRKVTAYNQVLESKVELGSGILTNSTITAAQELASLTTTPEKFFDCVYFDENQKRGVKCIMEEIRIPLSVAKNDSDTNLSTVEKATNGTMARGDSEEKSVTDGDITSLAQIEAVYKLPKGRSAYSHEGKDKETQAKPEKDAENKPKSSDNKKNKSSIPEETLTKIESSDSTNNQLFQSDSQTESAVPLTTEGPSVPSSHKKELTNSKNKKSAYESTQTSSERSHQHTGSKDHKSSQLPSKDLTKNSGKPKNHQSAYLSKEPASLGKNQRRNLQGVYNETSIDPKTSTEPVANSNANFDQFLKSPLIIDGSAYYLKKNNYLQKISSIQVVLTVILLMTLVSILTLIIAKKVTKNEIDFRLNRQIVEMMFEENSQSDNYKFYIFGSYEYIDVKVEALSQAPGDRTSLLLTGTDQLNDGRVRPLNSASKMSQYFDLKGREDPKDVEERRLIKERDTENQHESYEC
jgi:hypothetical protein